MLKLEAPAGKLNWRIAGPYCERVLWKIEPLVLRTPLSETVTVPPDPPVTIAPKDKDWSALRLDSALADTAAQASASAMTQAASTRIN